MTSKVTEPREHMTSKNKVPVLEYTLIRRVNRHLVDNDCKLVKNKKTRSKTNRRKLTKREIEFGGYFVVRHPGTDSARVIERHINLEEYARRCGVLEHYEALAPMEE
jgi:hypothetical protein